MRQMVADEAKSDKFLIKSKILSRGWTESGIKRFLKTPDDERPNPYNKQGAPMQLYLLERVEAIEATSEFQEWRAKAQKRRAAAKKGAETRKSKSLKSIEQVIIKVEVLELDQVQKRAIDSYNARSDNLASAASDLDFLDRITVNYIRHNLTSYDHMLDFVKGKTGVEDGSLLIAKRIFASIAERYPSLADECARQYEDAKREGKYKRGLVY